MSTEAINKEMNEYIDSLEYKVTKELLNKTNKAKEFVKKEGPDLIKNIGYVNGLYVPIEELK